MICGMPEIEFVLVSPLYDGNIGFCARVIKNFGFTSLTLINPCPLGDDAYARASHARDVLENAITCSLDDVFSRCSLAVATTGAVSQSVCHSIRMPFHSPRELRDRISKLDCRIAILFGRENWGLNNDEVARCDIICTIPTSEIYPILNLSHAVGILCYELANLERGEYKVASRKDMEYLYRHIDQYLNLINHPVHKRENTLLLLRRVLGRAKLTTREASTIHGLIRRSEWNILGDDWNRGIYDSVRIAESKSEGNNRDEMENEIV